MSVTLLHISDTHCGLRAGLITPGVELTYDNGEKRTVLASSISEWVLECYNRVIDTAIDFAGSDPVVVYHTGDVCHGNTFVEYLYSPWQEHQVQIATAALSLLRRIPTLAGFRLAYGTQEHDYHEQTASKDVADNLAAWGYPVECVSHGVEDVDGCLVDFSHHGPNITKGEDVATSGRRYAIRMIRLFKEREMRPPDIVLRGHYHTRLTEQMAVRWGRYDVPVMVSLAPPLCGPNSHSRKATHSAPLCEIGGTLIRVQNGRVVDWQARTFERENRVTIQGVDFVKYRAGYKAS